MKKILVPLCLFAALLCGCNTAGPYHMKVYRLDGSMFWVSVDTWIGSSGPYGKIGNDKLKHDGERAVMNILREHSLPVETCIFKRFIPWEGGHISLALIAGNRSGVAHWAALSDAEYDQAIRKKGLLPLVFTYDGSLPK